VLELWDFKIIYENAENGNAIGTKDLKRIQREIQYVLRKIFATVSLLPLLECLCKYTA
jgi:hypothetical protein